MPPAGDDYEPTMGAVQLLCHRRLRTVQKRVAKIQKAEEKLAAGGEIDDQQRELTDGKPLTMALLDEFTKLSQEIEKAVEEDRLTVLREERAKVAAKAERSQARRAVAGGGDRPIAEAGKNDSVPPAAPPAAPAPDGTVAKKERKRSGKKDREAPTDGAAPAQTPAPAAPADAKPPSSDADANPAAKPRRERGGRGKNKNKAESGDAAPAAVAPPAAAPAPGAPPAPGIASQGGAIVPNGGGPPGVERRAALDPRGTYGAPGVPVGVDGITVTFGSLGVNGGGGGGASAPGQSQEQKRPDAAALLDRRGAPADPVAPVEINLADYGFDDEYGAPDDLVDDNDYYPAPPPQQQQQQQRAQGKPRRREESAGAGTKRGGGERTRGGGERKEAGGRGRGGKEAGGGRGGGRGGRGGGRGQI
jgi:hypothetical protein